jgi:hypothetical protein
LIGAPPLARRWVAVVVVAVVVAGCSDDSGDEKPARTTVPRITKPSGTVTRPTTRPPTTKRPRRHVAFVPPSIDPTGRADVTASLQRFLASVPSGREIQFRKAGRYRVEGTLFLRNRHRMTIDGNGATVFATTRGGRERAQWWIKGGGRIVFRNLLVRGANKLAGTSDGAYVRKLETQHGFRFEGVNGAELDHVQVSDVYGDLVYVGRGRDRIPARNIWIHDSRFSGTGRQGIAITAANNVIVERNHLDRTRRSTFDLEPDTRSARVSNVFLLNNVIGPGRLLFVAAHGAGPVNNIVISGNRLVGRALTIDSIAPDRSPRRSNWVVAGNRSDTPIEQRALRFFRIDGLVVRGNRQVVTGDEPVVVLQDVCGARLSGNTFGANRIRRNTADCPAPFTFPKATAIPGRR